ncbi:MAG: sodium/solute symporter [Phycisphaerales bacterium]|nr:MAG: sodium/solute symporter [Phycisphaerales bacterium]
MMLGWLDFVVVGAYFVAILAVGIWFGRREGSTYDYFLGGKRQHWLVVGLSIIATEVSALTFISVPADSFQGDWNYLQMYAGAFLGRILIVLLLLPAFYGGAVTTVYEYLGQRFGPWTRTTASLMFIASRIIGSGIRLLAASLAIAVVFGWRLEWVVLGAAAVAIAYTTFGGIKAIIWTDALQAVIFLGGGVAVLAFLFLSIPGTCVENLSTAYNAGKLHTFTWGRDLNNEKLFWVLLISATVQNCAALGVDQDLTQRMLTCPDLRRGQRSLLFNAVMGLPIVCLFLLIGTMISVYYGTQQSLSLPAHVLDHSDRVFPHFIAHVLPSGYGLKGLLVAGIFAASMSSLDSALGALSSTAVTDFYRPFMARRRRHAETTSSQTEAGAMKELRLARFLTFFFGLLLAVVALSFAGHDRLLWEVFKWVGLIFGAMLGVFLLGVTTRTRGHDHFNTASMLSSIAILVVIKLYQEHASTVYIAWPWWVVIGTAWTYGLAACFSGRHGRPR